MDQSTHWLRYMHGSGWIGKTARSVSGYSLIQILSTLCIVLIVSTTAIMGYLKFLDKSRAAVCMTNQKAIVDALKDYEMENSALPAVLGQLERRHLEKGYAKVMAEAGWFVKVAHVAVKASMSSEAYAQFLTYENLENYGVGQETFRCPSDPNGGISYGLNSHAAGKTWFEIGDNLILVGDCDSGTFSSESQLRARHQSGEVAVGVTKEGTVVESKNGTPYGGDDSDGGSGESTDGSTDAEGDDGTDSDGDGSADDAADDSPGQDPDNSDTGARNAGEVYNALSELFAQNEGTPLGTQINLVLTDLANASDALADGDRLAALNSLKQAVDRLETAVVQGLDSVQANGFMEGIISDARQIASDAIDYAATNGGDASAIENAELLLTEGDTEGEAQAYSDAMRTYREVFTTVEAGMP